MLTIFAVAVLATNATGMVNEGVKNETSVQFRRKNDQSFQGGVETKALYLFPEAAWMACGEWVPKVYALCE